MAELDIVDRLAKGAAALCATLALSACASGAGMFVAGNDGGPSGFEEEQEQAFDEQSVLSEPVGEATMTPILATSGNSLLPLPGRFGSTPNALGPAGGPNLTTAASIGLGGAPLANATLALNGASPSLAVAVAGQPLATVSGGSVTVLGVAPTATVASVAPTVVSATTAATNTLVSTVGGAVAAVTAATPTQTVSPMLSMTPGVTPLSTVLSILSRPAGL